MIFVIAFNGPEKSTFHQKISYRRVYVIKK
jgi:hypothetical protein